MEWPEEMGPAEREYYTLGWAMNVLYGKTPESPDMTKVQAARFVAEFLRREAQCQTNKQLSK